MDGLQYLHSLGVVHGNLKGVSHSSSPRIATDVASTLQENVLISDEGRALIADFGFSCINMASAAAGTLSGTSLRFTAPEVVLVQIKEVNKPIDIWSFGCLFYTVY